MSKNNDEFEQKNKKENPKNFLISEYGNKQ